MLLRLLYKLVLAASLTALLSTVSAAQSPDKAPAKQEFPVMLQQSVKAGKTPVGTKIQAKLWVSTLVNGKVVPRNAIFSGEVVESSAKTASQPSRLCILLNSVSWKDGSAPIRAYMTSGFYPELSTAGPDLLYGPGQSSARNWNYGAGEYPNPNSRSYKPFPDDSGKDSGAPDTTSSVMAKNRVSMKGVEIQHDSGDRILLVSKHSDISFDHATVYVLESADLSSLK